jgi:hypothetical protein
VGFLSQLTHDTGVGVLSLIILFVTGGVILTRVKEETPAWRQISHANRDWRRRREQGLSSRATKGAVVTIKFDVDRSDYLAFNYQAIRNNNPKLYKFISALRAQTLMMARFNYHVARWSLKLKLPYVLFALLSAVAAVTAILGTTEGLLLLMYVILLILIAVLYLYYRRILKRGYPITTPDNWWDRIVKRRPTEDSGTLGEQRLTVSSQGISCDSTYESSEFLWESVLSIDEADDHIFIFLDRMRAHIIPKRAFKDDMHMKAFVGEAEGYLGKSRPTE